MQQSRFRAPPPSGTTVCAMSEPTSLAQSHLEAVSQMCLFDWLTIGLFHLKLMGHTLIGTRSRTPSGVNVRMRPVTTAISMRINASGFPMARPRRQSR